MEPQEGGCQGQAAQHGQGAGAEGRPAKVPQGLEHDGEHHRLDAVEQALGLGEAAEAHVGPGQRHREQGGRKDEAHPAQHEPGPARPAVAQAHGQLGGTGTRNEVGRAQQVQEVRPRQPFPAAHGLLFHEGDVGGGASEGGEAQAEEEAGHLRQGPRHGRARRNPSARLRKGGPAVNRARPVSRNLRIAMTSSMASDHRRDARPASSGPGPRPRAQGRIPWYKIPLR